MPDKTFFSQVNLFNALSHYKRLQIVNLLHKDELSVSEIHRKLGYSQSNISQHLMTLRKGGVVKTKREGKRVFYKLSTKRLIKLCDLINQIIKTE